MDVGPMKYILDTDILIYFLSQRPPVVMRFAETDPDDLATTIIKLTFIKIA